MNEGKLVCTNVCSRILLRFLPMIYCYNIEGDQEKAGYFEKNAKKNFVLNHYYRYWQ
jgi:hypothetical protein